MIIQNYTTKKKNLKENCKITKSGYENKMPLKQSD